MSVPGHIAGVVNPPSLGKYQHWTGEQVEAETLETWLEDATEVPGSWWPDWDKWLAKQSRRRKVAGRKPGATLGVLVPAPGSYVRVRLNDFHSIAGKRFGARRARARYAASPVCSRAPVCAMTCAASAPPALAAALTSPLRTNSLTKPAA